MVISISLSAIDHDYWAMIARFRGMSFDEYAQKAFAFYAPQAIKDAAEVSNERFKGKG